MPERTESDRFAKKVLVVGSDIRYPRYGGVLIQVEGLRAESAIPNMKSLDDGTVDVVLKSHEFQATGFVKLPKLQSAGSGHDYAEVRCSGGISVPLAWEFIDVCIWDEG